MPEVGSLREDALRSPERLAALAATALMDSAPEEPFDRFTRMAARLLGVPVALVSLVDDHRQFFKSAVGLPEPWASLRETPSELPALILIDSYQRLGERATTLASTGV